MLCNFLYLYVDIFCGLYLHSCVAFTIGLFIVFFLFFFLVLKFGDFMIVRELVQECLLRLAWF